MQNSTSKRNWDIFQSIWLDGPHKSKGVRLMNNIGVTLAGVGIFIYLITLTVIELSAFFIF